MARRLPARNLDFALLRPERPAVVPYDPFADPYQPIDEVGWTERILVATPAAGATNLNCLQDGSVWTQPLGFWGKLVTDANVANRDLYVEFQTDEGAVIVRADTTQTQAANTTGFWQYVIGENVFGTGNTGTRIAPMPYVLLPPGYRAQIRTASIQVGDQLSQLAFLVRRWRNRPRRLAAGHGLAAL